MRPTSDAPLLTAECFTIWLATGTVLTYTDLDMPVSLNGYTYLANSVLIAGLKYRGACGVNVDSQQVTLFARATDTIGGIPFLQAMQQGLLDGAEIQREKVFFTAWTAPIGSVILFKGRVSQDRLDRPHQRADHRLLRSRPARHRHAAQRLPGQLPARALRRNCGFAAEPFPRSGTVGAGSTQTPIDWSAANAFPARHHHLHLRRQYRNDLNDQGGGHRLIPLVYPLPYAPRVGDTFTVTAGCDHTTTTCKPLHQPHSISRLPLRAAAADHYRAAVLHIYEQRQGRQVGATLNEAEQRAAVVTEARKWILTPYHNCADIRGVGVDCGMLIVRVFVDLGLAPPFDPRPYAPDWMLHRDEEKYLGFFTERCTRVKAPRPGESSCSATAAAIRMAALSPTSIPSPSSTPITTPAA